MFTEGQKKLLKETVCCIENITSEIDGLKDDIKGHLAGAKDAGLDPKGIKFVLKHRKTTELERTQEQDTLDAYLLAMGELTENKI